MGLCGTVAVVVVSMGVVVGLLVAWELTGVATSSAGKFGLAAGGGTVVVGGKAAIVVAAVVVVGGTVVSGIVAGTVVVSGIVVGCGL
jgi:hypothetical protein